MLKRIGLVRVLTTRDQLLLESHRKIIEAAYPNLEVTSRCIPDHPEGVHDRNTRDTAAPLVAELALAFEREGFDAVVVSCADDPGVELSRQALRIPVIGAGEATAAVALGLGGKVGVLRITAEVPQRMRVLLGDSLVCSAKPDGVSTTLDLLREGARESVVEAAMALKAQGARIVAFACTGLSTIGASALVESATGLKVVDPVLAEGLIAYFLVSS